MPKTGRALSRIWTRQRVVGLCALLLCGFSTERLTFAANDDIAVIVKDAAGDQPFAVERLPPLDSMFSDSSTRTADQGVREAGYVFAAPLPGNQTDLESDTPAQDELPTMQSWLDHTRVGYDRGFVVLSDRSLNLQGEDSPFLLRVNGLVQLRQTHFESTGPTRDLNQFQLIRGRIAFSGHALTPDLGYFIQLDGRSSAGDEFRLLDYIMDFDFGQNLWGLDRRALVFKAGKYKVPFTLARYLSAREFQFCDRSMASMYFDVNRSLAWGLYGQAQPTEVPVEWEMALFNGIVTGGSETGSSGELDNNFAYSARVFTYPTANWGTGALADFDWHESLATRFGAAFVGSTIDRIGPTEFQSIRVVDSGLRLSTLLPDSVTKYDVHMYCVDASCKYRGWSLTSEYYFRIVSGFERARIPNLYDHGFWLQVGKFVVPGKVELLSRWSRVVGDSGTLGLENQSADEIAAGFAWYFNGQNAKLTCDATHLNGAPINASSLDIFAGDRGWLFRTQIQLAF